MKWYDMILNENPMITVKDIDPEYVDVKLNIPIGQAFLNKGVYATNNENIFKIPKMYSGIYLYMDGDNVVGAVDFDITYIEKETMLTPSIVKKFENDYKGILHTLYKEASNYFKMKIVSDKVQTMDSSSIWKRWFLNPEKHDIEEIYTIPKGLTKVDDIWGDEEKYKDVRIVVKFKN
jgi:hypothetical protein